MSDLIDRQALLRQIDIDSDGEPGYYGDTWKFIDTIKRIPSALSTNLAEVGTDCISRQQAIDAVCMEWCGVKHQDCKHPFDVENDDYYWCDGCETVLQTLPDLPPAQPEIIRCKDCRWRKDQSGSTAWLPCRAIVTPSDFYCGRAERRTDE